MEISIPKALVLRLLAHILEIGIDNAWSPLTNYFSCYFKTRKREKWVMRSLGECLDVSGGVLTEEAEAVAGLVLG